jgi:phage baseplate assembly protein W
MNADYPFRFDARGGTALADDARHVRNMIEQLLFTNPGERVNRPQFGAGLLQTIFAPNGEQLAAALQVMLQAALQQSLGDAVEVQQLEVSSQDAQLRVVLDYVLSKTGEGRQEVFERSVA